MKCEICHRAEAETAVTVTVDGAEKELYVCAACAAEVKSGQARRTRPSSGRKPRITVVGDGGKDVPQPLVEEFVKATLGFMKGMAEAEAEAEKPLVCPACGLTWAAAKERGSLGCPSCWKAFSREIREEFLRGEYGPVHTGAAPAVERLQDPSAARKVLERELKDAIAREDYRRAAELKRRLDGFGDAGKERA